MKKKYKKLRLSKLDKAVAEHAAADSEASTPSMIDGAKSSSTKNRLDLNKVVDHEPFTYECLLKKVVDVLKEKGA